MKKEYNTIMLYYDEYGKENEEIIVLLSGAGVLDTFYHFYALDKVYHLVVPHLPGTGVNASENNKRTY